MERYNKDSKNIVKWFYNNKANLTIITINVLNNISNEINKLRDWLVVHNDTLDKNNN